MTSPHSVTEDGIELHFGTNHIGIRFPAPNPTAWDKDSINEDKGLYLAYGISKLANVYYAQELTRRLQEKGITNVTANSVHPGRILTSLGRQHIGLMRFMYLASFWTWKSIPQGASGACYVALHPFLNGVSGKYFVDNNEFDPKAYHPSAEDEQARS